MKIDKEKFNKLKQLDRIEYRQKWTHINSGGVNFNIHVWGLIIIATIFGTVGIVSSRISFLTLSLALYKIAFVVFIASIGFNVMDFIFQHVRTRKLEEEYFSVEVKKK